jgi:methylenetetrahydrofolate dehydrogenase (NADP+)/methenyltetrahydrofolate cyclohydrolase
MAQIIDGKKVAAEIREELRHKAAELYREHNIKPGLAILLVGNNPASEIYVKMKIKACAETGFHSVVEREPDDIPESKVLDYISKWNADPEIHGILVQLPLPGHIDENKVIEAISPEKDVDGFHPVSAGKLLLGLDGFVSCTPAGIMELIKRYGIETSGKHAVVVGRSNIVGKPVANLMARKSKNANSIVTICHSAAGDIGQYTRQADILISAVGSPLMIKKDMVKEGAVIFDVGINRVDDSSAKKGYRVVGDVDFDPVKDIASAITPVPGGIGPMTIAMLLSNTFESAAKRI